MCNDSFEFDNIKPIKGYPELRWTGKRPFTFTNFYPAQLKEVFGEEKEGWMNKLFWGDNLQVMSHLLKEYRGKIDLIYIDPPFDSKATYKRKIELKQYGKTETDISTFEEKQYGDIWTNDEYLQFMYERLILMRELLSDTGSLYLHCDWHKSGYLRCILDEVFGKDNFVNEIIWSYKTSSGGNTEFNKQHDNIYLYQKSFQRKFNMLQEKSYTKAKHRKAGIVNYGASDTEFFEDDIGVYRWSNMRDVWDVSYINSQAIERTGYPTQKPEALIERIIKASSEPGDIIFDCFMGSGTTQAVAMKLGRRFLGADINLGAIQTATKRLLDIVKDLNNDSIYRGFEVYNVNNYDLFRNPIEAKAIIIQALDIQPFNGHNLWDGELDGRMVKIMPVNRIASKADLEEIKANLPYKEYDKIKANHPNKTVEYITLICMGHEPDLKIALERDLSHYKVDVQVIDILKDKKNLVFKRNSEAKIIRTKNFLEIKNFYPMNLLQKLSLEKTKVEDWRELVDSIMIDWNYDGVTLQPSIIDISDKNSVSGKYKIPDNAGTIRVKITDILSESLELEA